MNGCRFVALSHSRESFLPGSTCLGFKFDPVCGPGQDSTVRCRLAFGGRAHQNYNFRERDDHVGERPVLNLNRRPHVANCYQLNMHLCNPNIVSIPSSFLSTWQQGLPSLRQTRRGICRLKTDGPTTQVYMQDFLCSQSCIHTSGFLSL
jgi:hypothetical protein